MFRGRSFGESVSPPTPLTSFGTPLSLLRTRLETALLQRRSPDQYETTIVRSVAEIDRLTSIVEALLRSARGVDREESVCGLEELVHEGANRWRERYEEGGLTLVTSSTPAFAAIPPDEMRVVLDNLLVNALRYAPAGSTVDLSLERDGGEARLSVRDRGPGVPPELGERIFDRFVRADDSRNRAAGGAGIGLSVCRQIVEGRGGRMTLVPEAKGVSIGFALPAHAEYGPDR